MSRRLAWVEAGPGEEPADATAAAAPDELGLCTALLRGGGWKTDTIAPGAHLPPPFAALAAAHGGMTGVSTYCQSVVATRPAVGSEAPEAPEAPETPDSATPATSDIPSGQGHSATTAPSASAAPSASHPKGNGKP